jgi:hypothetical protein
MYYLYEIECKFNIWKINIEFDNYNKLKWM